MARAASADGTESGSWWKTLPGVLTAIAGLITAVTGLVVAVHQFLPQSSAEPSSPPAAVTPSASAGATDASTPTVPEAARPAAFSATFPAGARATVGAAVYTIRGAHIESRNPGELSLKLVVRLTNTGRYDANFWDRSFRLLVDGVPRAPISGLDDIAPAQSAADGTVEFVVPQAARKLTLLVGDQPDDAVRIPVALAPAKSR